MSLVPKGSWVNTVFGEVESSRARRAVERGRDRYDQAKARSLAEVLKIREAQNRHRHVLGKYAHKLHGDGGPIEARAIRELIEHVLCCAALDATAHQLQVEQPLSLAVHGARIRALSNLAVHVGETVRAQFDDKILDIARRHREMEDTAAWACAARRASGSARARFAMAAVAAAGRSASPRDCFEALSVAPKQAVCNLAHLAVRRLASTSASAELQVIPSSSYLLADACKALTPKSARKLALCLAQAPTEALPYTAILYTRARARLLARTLPLLPERERLAIAQQVVALTRGDNYHWLDEDEDKNVLESLCPPGLDTVLRESLHPAAVAPRLAQLRRTAEAGSLLESLGGGWYTAYPALRAAVFAPEKLGRLAQDLMSHLDAPSRGRLCGELAQAAVRVLGPETTLRYADESGDETGQYVRIVALARVASALPEPYRSDAAKRAVQVYREDPDIDALCELLACAEWMPRHEAAWLLFANLGRDTEGEPFEQVFVGYCSIGRLSPLIARAAGDLGMLVASEAVVSAEGWV
jgi:hypothetical protein